MDQQTQRSENSINLDHEIVLENPISEEIAGYEEENPNEKRIRDPMDEGTSGNSSNSANAEEIVSIREENKDLAVKIDELGLKTGSSDVENGAGRGTSEALSRVGSVHGAVLETVIFVNSEENQSIHSELETSKVMVQKSKKNVAEGKKKSCVIDVISGNGGGYKDCDGERVCRICHLSSEGLADTKPTGFSAELIQLGCGCKDELGSAHGYCAEAWFKLKGNRICEICGEMARNITGIGDNRFIEEWNQRRYVGSRITIPSDGNSGCWRGQPFCNFLMACLFVAFVLPWFFRINVV